MNGRYTQSSRGSNECGGWTEEIVRQFNQLCALVQESRRHPLAPQKGKINEKENADRTDGESNE